MSVSCDASGSVIVSTCQFGEEGEFTIEVHATKAPDEGYDAFEIKLLWDGAVLDYRQSENASQELMWPSCDIATRFDNRLHIPPDTSGVWGCVTFPVERSDYTGVLTQLTFACIAPGTSQLSLVEAAEGAVGSIFIQANDDLTSTSIDPQLTDATVTCSGATPPTATETLAQTPAPGTPNPTPQATSTPDASVTATSTPDASVTATSTPTPIVSAVPTATPSPTVTGPPVGPTLTPTLSPTPSLLGDASCDGKIDARDARLIFQVYVALLSSLPCDNADVNLDGRTGAVDAALILQLAAGLIQQLPA